MSTKTIAVDSRVYDRLASAKKEGESFSKVLDRILTQIESTGTGRDILRGLEDLPPLSAADAEVFLEVIRENRADENWTESDLR
jgi:predicted CopG family antitoxin